MDTPTTVGPSQTLSEKNAQAVHLLRTYVNPAETSMIEMGLKYPRNKLAAVLVLLFEKDGQLRVLLTTRSKRLRTHPGQTALPGGKCEPQDDSFLATALRETYEECGLDPNSPSLQYLTQLSPFLSQWKLIVIPVVVLCTDQAFVDTLIRGTDEVDAIFSHPLEAILDPSLALHESLSEKGGEGWPYEEDLYNITDSTWTQIHNTVYRMHRFRSSGSAIKGLTADILILAAEIAFAKQSVYQRYAPGQATQEQLALWAIEDYQRDGFIVPLMQTKPTVLGTAATAAAAAGILPSREQESTQ